MQKTATTPSKILDLTAAAFLLVAFLTGIAGALQTPTLSIFLADELKARPIMVGFFFTGSAIMGILVSQFLARHSDKQGDRKLLISAMLLIWSAGLHAFCVESQLLHSPLNGRTSE